MDREILLFFESLRSAPVDAFFSALTRLGAEEIAVLLICVILWCVNKKLGYRLALTLFLAQGVNQVMKIFFAVPRPWDRWPGIVTPVSSAVAGATGFSFPSGHTSTATAVYPTLAHRGLARQADPKRKRAAWLAAGLCLVIVGVSRIYLGVHTATDVWVSMLVTGGVAWLANGASDRVEQQRWPYRALFIGGWIAAALVLAAGLGFLLVHAGDAARLAQTLDAFKAGGAMAGFIAGWQIERRWIRADVRASLRRSASPRAPASLREQVLKAVGGLGVLFLLKMGLKPALAWLLPCDPVAHALRYAAISLWATCGLPAVVKWAQGGFKRTAKSG